MPTSIYQYNPVDYTPTFSKGLLLHIPTDINRLAALDLAGLRDGDRLYFCPNCIWQHPEPNIVAVSECPVCLNKLHTMMVDES